MTSEFWQCLRIATESFCVGIMLREFAPDSFGKWIGRASVFSSFWLMACFAAYSTTNCETARTELAVQGASAFTADNIAFLGSSFDGMRSISGELQQRSDANQSEAVRIKRSYGGSGSEAMGAGSSLRASSNGLDAAQRMLTAARRAANAKDAEF